MRRTGAAAPSRMRMRGAAGPLSGTRLPPSLGGYQKEKGGSLFSKNNPFGLEGPFRTIQANYDLHFSVEVDPHMTVSGAWKIDPSKILPGVPPSF